MRRGEPRVQGAQCGQVGLGAVREQEGPVLDEVGMDTAGIKTAQ